jgi:hypothetical protein
VAPAGTKAFDVARFWPRSPFFRDSARKLRQAMRLITERHEEILADFHLTMLRIAHPEFRFTTEPHPPGRPRWVAVRRNLAAGLHTVVTGDLDELIAVIGPPDLPGKPIDRDPGEMCRHTAPANAAGGGI